VTPGSERRPLEADEAHVWRIRLDEPAETVARMRELLNDDERRRADRFMFEEHRHRFTVGRATLRAIVGSYTGIAPSEICFRYNPYGKPELDRDQGGDRVRFNLSNTGALALCAVAEGRSVGVDVETHRADFAGLAIAERFFSPAEVAVLRGVRREDLTRAFFACWTRKEAYIKAQGKGLSIPLDSFEVSLAPDAPPALLVTHDDPAEARRWSLFELDPGPGFAAALVIEGNGCRVRVADWPEAVG
jgi:4'-phosphopantetheinyl transferase